MFAPKNAILACLFVFLSETLDGSDWPQWRGPNRDGISTESGWSTQWPAAGPKKAWTATIGEGYSAPIVVAGKVYTYGNTKEVDEVRCLDLADGKELWKYPFPCASAKQWPGPRSTPTFNDGIVYVVSRKGHLHAIDASSGTGVWQIDFHKQFGANQSDWDLVSSPLVEGDLLITEAGGKGTSVVALNKKTGALVWKAGNEQPAYSNPTPFAFGQGRGVAVFNRFGLFGYNLANGQELFRHPWKTSYNVNAADPIFVNGQVFLASGYKAGCALVDLTKGQPFEIYRKPNIMSNHVTTSTFFEGHLYGNDGQAGKNPLTCMELATGTIRWQEKDLPGTMVLVNKKLLVLSSSGTLILADASPKTFQRSASAKVLEGECWTVPVFSHGHILCRNTAGTLVCLDVSGK